MPGLQDESFNYITNNIINDYFEQLGLPMQFTDILKEIQRFFLRFQKTSPNA